MKGAAAWTERMVGQCLLPTSFRSKGQIQARDYRPAGRYPVIDQGQSVIAGWTDDDSAVINAPLPVVVFGDHSRALKFVDFPFVRGADGTQVLVPASDLDPLFFYYACKFIDVPARGYNRHFVQLKDSVFPCPSTIDAQRGIARALRWVERAISQEAERLALAMEIKQVAMASLFTRGLRGEAQKETEIGWVPQSWNVEPLGARCSVSSGGTPSRGNPAYWFGGEIPWVKTTEVNYCTIGQTEERITLRGLEQSAAKLLPDGTLLMAMYGQGVTRGRVAILGIEAACNQACAAISANDGAIIGKYLYHFLSWRYEAIRQLAHGGQQQNLNLDIVRALSVAAPAELSEQQEVVSILDAIDCKIARHQQKRAVLEERVKALLHKLMTGEIDVNDLDLQALSAHEPGIEASPA